MSVSFIAHELEGDEREQIAGCRQRLGAGDSGLLDNGGDIELRQERCEEEDPTTERLEALVSACGNSDGLRGRRNKSVGDGPADLERCPARKAREAFLGEDAFDGADADVDVLTGEQLDDVAGREVLLTPVTDLGADVG
jgi:hypothetical protein